MAIQVSQKSLRKGILGCGCLGILSGVGMGIVGIVLILLGLFGDKPSQAVAVTSVGKTYEIHDRHVTGINDEIVLKLTLTGKSGYLERGRTVKRRHSLAFTIPLNLKVFDANSGKLLHEHTQMLGYDRKKRGNPEDCVYLATITTVNIPIPELGHVGDVRYELTLDENKDYEFTLQKASFQLMKRDAGFYDKLLLGPSITWLAVSILLAAFSILIVRFLMGRNKS